MGCPAQICFRWHPCQLNPYAQLAVPRFAAVQVVIKGEIGAAASCEMSAPDRIHSLQPQAGNGVNTGHWFILATRISSLAYLLQALAEVALAALRGYGHLYHKV